MSVEDDISRRQFELIAQELMARSTHIRNVALAEGSVITHLYPATGEGVAIGTDLSKIPAQWATIKQAIKSAGTVVTGPIKGEQGGIVFINRTPIFKAASPYDRNPDDLWGVANLVVDMESILLAAGLPEAKFTYRMAIQHNAGLGAGESVFWGERELFNQDPEQITITFANGTWQLAALPYGGWQASNEEALWIWLGGFAIALLLATLSTFNYHNRLRMKHHALHDPLTQLPNRLLFTERASQALAHTQRRTTKVAIAVLELNRFKPINEIHGHAAGDYVLKQMANRIRHTLRKEDIVARAGGDEFSLLLVDIDSVENIATILGKMTEQLLEPVFWHGQPLYVGVSIGITLYPIHGNDLATLFRHADKARHDAKNNPHRHWMLAELPGPSAILTQQSDRSR